MIRLRHVASLFGVIGALAALPAFAAGATPIKAEAQTADYRLDLRIGPMEQMYSAADVAAKHLTEGEVMAGGMMSMIGASVNKADIRHLEIHVYALDGGKVVTDAAVTIAVTDTGTQKSEDVPPAKMYGIKEGVPDTHFGNNVDMPPGNYTIDVTVDGEKAAFDVVVPAA
jgi:hypothetical protein